MKKIFSYLITAVFGIYFVGTLIFAPYYNWHYARTHGFVKWLLFGEVVATAKSFAWPYWIYLSVTKKEQVPLQNIIVSDLVIKELKTKYFFQEAIKLFDSYKDREKTREYLMSIGRYKYLDSEQQAPFMVEGYSDSENPFIIGISLYFLEQRLLMANVLLHPREKQDAVNFIKEALDSTDAPEGRFSQKAKLYFLGIYPLGSKIVKIAVREDMLPTGTVVYSINYALSEK